MKTYISALLLAGATLTAVSCDRNNDTQVVNDQDTIALVTETTVSFMSASAQASTKGNIGTSPVNYQDYNAVV